MTESLKQRVERGIGEPFVQWYNRTNGSNFAFERFGADPPDLIYRDGTNVLPVEITTSYYDENDATRRWKHARNNPTATDRWLGINPDASLIAFINDRIANKCIGTHDPATILVIGIYAAITSNVEFEELRRSIIIIPRSNPFVAIYAAGTFPSSSHGPGGYCCWKLDQKNADPALSPYGTPPVKRDVR